MLNGDNKAAVASTKEAIAENANPMDLVGIHMIPAMGEVGRRFECSEYFVPELRHEERSGVAPPVVGGQRGAASGPSRH